ncbi:hypothetical protein [Gilvibacter sediminis]|uniref:hypothetical protein n=1 Tax=Gilvibacter sediminis TaxID=379071 RepID=UPI002350CA78|nr:hypothetical protein [Gilvibacter sediminis]MDC7998940.1 hypothetical protein [Gilvibacter sediminis]
MIKKVVFIISLISLLLACEQKDKQTDRLAVAQDYYEMLNTNDLAALPRLMTDSITTREPKYDYQQTFARSGYVDWMKWDAMFKPNYEVLKMEEVDSTVVVEVAKSCKRIEFLHGEPIITRQVLYFDEQRISIVETKDEIVFKDSVWVANRQKLLDFMQDSFPEFESFIFDQTEEGAQRYLQAIVWYEDVKGVNANFK